MRETAPERSGRKFTKRLVIVNLILVWALIFISVIYQQSQYVVDSGFALIGLMFGVYTGIGHLDYRKVIEASVNQLTKGNRSYDP